MKSSLLLRQQMEEQQKIGIEWKDEHDHFILKQLAQFDRPSDAVDNCLREYADEFSIIKETQEESQSRLKTVRQFVYKRTRYLTYHPNAEKLRENIVNYRREFMEDALNFIPESNKSVRIKRLADIARKAERAGDFRSAVRALLAIDLMQKNWKPNLYINNTNITANIQNNVYQLTDDEARANLKRLIGAVPENGHKKTNGKAGKGSNGTH